MFIAEKMPIPFKHLSPALIVILVLATLEPPETLAEAPQDNATSQQQDRSTSLEQLTHPEWLPLLHPDVQVHYVGSIDKKGGNADWDWWLYQDQRTKEWVIMDAQGPGCLWNFVAHHAVGISDPVYRFYFDGGDTPAFEIKHSEFGDQGSISLAVGRQVPAPGGKRSPSQGAQFPSGAELLSHAFRQVVENHLIR